MGYVIGNEGLEIDKSTETDFLKQYVVGSSKKLESWFVRQRELTIVIYLIV
jgi:hypothetical protein